MGATYIAESPLLAGVRWLRIEFNLSVAILNSLLLEKGKSAQSSVRRVNVENGKRAEIHEKA